MPAGIRVTAPLDSDPETAAARLVVEGPHGVTIEVRLTARACGRLAAKLLEHAGRSVRGRIEEGFAPLVELGNNLSALLGDGDD